MDITQAVLRSITQPSNIHFLIEDSLNRIVERYGGIVEPAGSPSGTTATLSPSPQHPPKAQAVGGLLNTHYNIIKVHSRHE